MAFYSVDINSDNMYSVDYHLKVLNKNTAHLIQRRKGSA